MSEIINRFNIKSLNKYYHYLHRSDYVFYGHRHTDTEINIILKGAMEITCENNVFRAEEGSVVAIPPCSFHQNRVADSSNAEMLVFHFEPEKDDFKNEPMIFSLTSDISRLLDLLCSDLEKNGQIKNGTCIKINESALKLFEIFLQYAKSTREDIVTQPSEYSVIYNKAVNYMLENIGQNVTMSQISRACGVCNTTLKKVFSHYTLRGCMTFFSELKLDKAKEMLLAGKSCSFVSNSLGFSSQCYFSKRFKMLYGVSPSRYHEG